MSYENPWVFKGRTFLSEDINDLYGFVYRITNLQSGKKYIGRKYFWSFRTPPGKREKLNKKVIGSDIMSSCPELKDDIKKYGKEIFSREILSLHKTKGTCNYEETKQLFLNNVLSEALDDGAPAYYNSNILGRYMRKDYGNFGGNSIDHS